jgi:hypothetical protein
MSEIDSTATTAFATVSRDFRTRGIELWISSIRERNWSRAPDALNEFGEAAPP